MGNKTDKISTPADTILKEHFLLKTVEILKILNISRTTFDTIKTLPDFPKAITKVGSRPLWVKDEILRWLQNGK